MDSVETADHTPPTGAGGEVDEPVPTVRQLLREALDEHRASIRQSAEEGKPPPILELIGGKLGIVESVVPVAVFSVVYGVSKDLRTAIIAALVPSALTTIYRLARRETLTSAISGLMGVGIGALIAWRTGGAANFFIPGAVKNGFFAVALLISIIVRWPLVGVFLGFVLGEDTAWRQNEARRRAYSLATWVWFGMFAIRVAVQVPLLLTGQAVKLGFVNLLLGLPLYGGVLVLTWLIVRRVPVVHLEATAESEPTGESEPTAESEATAESGPTVGSVPAVESGTVEDPGAGDGSDPVEDDAGPSPVTDDAPSADRPTR